MASKKNTRKMSQSEWDDALAMDSIWDRRFKRYEDRAPVPSQHSLFPSHKPEPVDPDVWKKSDHGDGYICIDHGERRGRCCKDAKWGRFGAAGILFIYDDPKTGERYYLLNQRSFAINHGGQWSTLGGAIDRGETLLEGALREAREEMGGWPERYEVLAEVTQRLESGWEYTTFALRVDEMLRVDCTDWESIGHGWFRASEIAALELHPGFSATWPTLAMVS